MLAPAITQPPVHVASRRIVAIRFPVAGRPGDPAARSAAGQLVLGRRCRRRVVG
jgi:hypothetical protein